MPSDIKDLIERAEELDSKDYVIFCINPQHHGISCKVREKSLKWNQVESIVYLYFYGTELVFVGFVTFQNIVLRGFVAF